MSRPRSARRAGFTLVEALVASAILMAILGATFQILAPSQGILRAQPEVADLQQRIRVAVDALASDLRQAGAGPPAGALAATLAQVVPAVVPVAGRTGSRASRGYDSGTVSLLRAPPAGGAGVAATAVPARSSAVTLAPDGCAVSASSVCGFRRGVRALIVAGGRFDLVTVVALVPALREVRFDRALTRGYGAGASVVEVVEHAYWVEDASAPPALVRAVDGGPAMPMVEHVVGLRVDYFDEYGPLPLAVLADGPWWPPAASPMRYDVDLLRVRRVRVELRVEVAAGSLRGAAGPRFARGSGVRAASLVPDRVVTVEVRLRNGMVPP